MEESRFSPDDIRHILTILRDRGVSLVEASLERADLHDVDLAGADLTRANLAGANLTGVNFEAAILLGANLEEAVVDGNPSLLVNYTAEAASSGWAGLGPGVNFVGANLEGANLKNADLFKSNFTGANLIGANLSGTNLFLSNFMGANLVGATANANEYTRWPYGFDPVAAGVAIEPEKKFTVGSGDVVDAL